MARWLPCLLWMACTPDEAPIIEISTGSADACLGNTAAVAPPDVPFVVYEFSGTIQETIPGVTDFNLVACDGATKLLQVRDTNQTDWLIGWTVKGQAGDEIAPTPDVLVGAQVDVLFRANDDGKSAGFVVAEIDDGPLVAAMDAGVDTNALGADEVPGATVWFGEWVTTEDLECGTAHGYQIDFQGDELVSVDPVADAKVVIRGTTFTAQAISAYEYDSEPLCSTVGNQLMWTLFRDPA